MQLQWGYEFYCFGYLFQVVVVCVCMWFDVDDGFIDIVCCVVDFVCDEFGVDGCDVICGYVEVEVGFLEFGCVLGEQ